MMLSSRTVALAAALVTAGFTSSALGADPMPFTPAYPWAPPTIHEAKQGSWESVQRARTQPITPRPLHYPNLDSPLYPCPRQDIPLEMGATVFTNSYIYPHEMLYHHRYKAIYPPFYYKVKWQYGVRKTANPNGTATAQTYRTRVMHKVELKGTEVDVRYNNWSPLDLFVAPTN